MNATLAFLGPIGGPEMIMIFVVILLLFGAKKLPELARGIGKSMGEFKKAREDFEYEITRSEADGRRAAAAKTEGKSKEELEAEIARLKAESAVREASGKEPRDI
ncbi:MAG: twin-arginine translocase TatA/TatE family subunit [Verrucomicrobiaceae bacterium]|nr:MAG: twin-arginine translocase TatA/TatE family subunit [Verrucomicrobiaceae bacterium]